MRLWRRGADSLTCMGFYPSHSDRHPRGFFYSTLSRRKPQKIHFIRQHNRTTLSLYLAKIHFRITMVFPPLRNNSSLMPLFDFGTCLGEGLLAFAPLRFLFQCRIIHRPFASATHCLCKVLYTRLARCTQRRHCTLTKTKNAKELTNGPNASFRKKKKNSL